MMPLEKFEEYLEKGIVKKKSPDKLRADALTKEAEESFLALKVLAFLNKTYKKLTN